MSETNDPNVDVSVEAGEGTNASAEAEVTTTETVPEHEVARESHRVSGQPETVVEETSVEVEVESEKSDD